MEFNHHNTESVARKANLGGVVLPFARSPPASNLKISLKEVKVAKQGAGNGLVCLGRFLIGRHRYSASCRHMRSAGPQL